MNVLLETAGILLMLATLPLTLELIALSLAAATRPRPVKMRDSSLNNSSLGSGRIPSGSIVFGLNRLRKNSRFVKGTASAVPQSSVESTGLQPLRDSCLPLPRVFPQPVKARPIPARGNAPGAAPDENPRAASPNYPVYGGQPLHLAVVVPAHNEEKLIGICVASLRASRGIAPRIYVVAHNCNDRTGEIAAAAGAIVLPLDGPGGKGLALDRGFHHALEDGANGVLVIDADSIVSENLLAEVAGAISGGAQAVQARYQVANAGATPRTRLAALALLGMNVLRPRGRDRLGLSCGIFGNGFALSAETLRRVPYTANSLVEDLEYHLRLIEAGVRVEFLDRAAVYGEMPEKSAAAATQRARWEGGRKLMRRQWSMTLFRSVLRGQLRMLEPLLDLLSLPLASQTSFLLVAWLLPLGWLRAYALLGFAAVMLYLLVAASLSPNPAESLLALLGAPGYMAWKLMMIPRTRLAARRDAAWVRTQRNAENEKPAD